MDHLPLKLLSPHGQMGDETQRDCGELCDIHFRPAPAQQCPPKHLSHSSCFSWVAQSATAWEDRGSAGGVAEPKPLASEWWELSLGPSLPRALSLASPCLLVTPPDRTDGQMVRANILLTTEGSGQKVTWVQCTSPLAPQNKLYKWQSSPTVRKNCSDFYKTRGQHRNYKSNLFRGRYSADFISNESGRQVNIISFCQQPILSS